MSGLKGRQLRVLRIRAAVNPVARLDARRLVGVGRRARSVRVLREGAGILFDHAGEVREPRVNVVTFDNGRPELVLSLVHGILGSDLRLLPRAVPTAVPPEGQAVLLLLRLHREPKSTGGRWVWAGVEGVAKLRRLLSEDLRLG